MDFLGRRRTFIQEKLNAGEEKHEQQSLLVLFTFYYILIQCKQVMWFCHIFHIKRIAHKKKAFLFVCIFLSDKSKILEEVVGENRLQNENGSNFQ